jgi:hypothetical protein
VADLKRQGAAAKAERKPSDDPALMPDLERHR